LLYIEQVKREINIKKLIKIATDSNKSNQNLHKQYSKHKPNCCCIATKKRTLYKPYLIGNIFSTSST